VIQVHRHGITTFSAILISLGCTSLLAQGPDPKLLEKTAAEIKLKNRMIDAALLASDQSAIAASFPAIQENFRVKGFSGYDVNEAIAAGWKDFRAAPGALTPLRGEVFKARVTSFGKLRIESKPGEASIFIDADPQAEKTDTSKWLAPGTYRIRLSKEGYFPEEERRKVVEGENPPFVKVLKPRP
jgi:hypothetical protein